MSAWDAICTRRFRCPSCGTVTRYPVSMRAVPSCVGVPSSATGRHARVAQVEIIAREYRARAGR